MWSISSSILISPSELFSSRYASCFFPQFQKTQSNSVSFGSVTPDQIVIYHNFVHGFRIIKTPDITWQDILTFKRFNLSLSLNSTVDLVSLLKHRMISVAVFSNRWKLHRTVVFPQRIVKNNSSNSIEYAHGTITHQGHQVSTTTKTLAIENSRGICGSILLSPQVSVRMKKEDDRSHARTCQHRPLTSTGKENHCNNNELLTNSKLNMLWDD